MRLVSWKIMAGGGARCPALVEALCRYDADVLVLQETLPARGPDLCHALKSAGYRYGVSAPRAPNQRGLCVLARRPIRRRRGPRPPHAAIYPRGWLELDVSGAGFRLAAVYGPSSAPELPAFWNAVAAWLRRCRPEPFLLLGDYNAGASGVDAERYRFKAGRGFAALAGGGLVDLWRREHGDRREHTWFSYARGGGPGRGFRIDHAFASAALAPWVRACGYDHAVRERRLSDHSALLVELADGAGDASGIGSLQRAARNRLAAD
jgi:exodeoxyribonuclease III